jgi:hypothetical protein
VQVQKEGDLFLASVGKETFDVELRIDLKTGAIRAATMHNPVEKITRECTDAALTACAEPHPMSILRRIEMRLE